MLVIFPTIKEHYQKKKLYNVRKEKGSLIRGNSISNPYRGFNN